MEPSKNNTLASAQLYKKIKNRCKFQLNFSGFLLIFFFGLQYSVPIFLVVLGSLATSREQLVSFLEVSPSPPINQSTKNDQKKISEAKAKTDAEILVSKIIFLLGIITILLGVINNTIRPAESYDTCSTFNNKFHKFIIDLDLEIINFGGVSVLASANREEIKLVCEFLIKKNKELCDLIDEYNQARSLSPRQANIKALNQSNDEKELKSNNSGSIEVSDEPTDNSLDDKLNGSSEPSNHATDKSLVDTRNT